MNAAEKSLFEEEVINRLGKLAILIATVVILTVEIVVLSPESLITERFVEGEVAKQTVRAPRDRVLEDPISTEKLKAKARASVPRIFSFRKVGESEILSQVDEIFSVAQNLSISNDPSLIELGFDERIKFEQTFNVDFEGDEWSALSRRDDWPELRKAVSMLVLPLLDKGIIASKDPLIAAFEQGSQVKVKIHLGDGNELEQDGSALAEIILQTDSVAQLERAIVSNFANSKEDFRLLLSKLCRYFLTPNVTYNAAETTKLLIEAEQSVPTAHLRVKKGEVIVRAGSVVSAEHEWKIRQLTGIDGAGAIWSSFFGYSLLSTIILVSSYLFAQGIWRNFEPRKRDLTVIALTLIGSVLMLRMAGHIGSALEFVHPEFVTSAFILAAPVAAGGIMLQVTLGMPSVFIFIMSLTLLTGVFIDNSWLLCVLIFVGNVVGSLSMKKSGRRSAFLRTGIRVAFANILVVFAFYLLFPSQGFAEFSNRLLWSLAGGLMCGIIGIALTPVAEWIGGYVTDFKLLELASLDQPLLKELSVQAPGTWNHSMVIGQIGEAAAEAIGANALLTRVGAYYHDIGKIKKPAYFIENQAGKENRHDKLTPSMSALIVKAHVKDGVEMARKYGLPEPLIDFIPEHHGTSLIEYFYKKAQEEAGEDEEVDETHYRYSGPKPQSREAGILMLADVVEASSRVLTDHTPAKIQGLVQKVLNKIFVSGELEESHLTLKDLHLIARSFTRVLSGIYHRRIDYGEPVDKSGEREARQEELADAAKEQKKKGQVAEETVEDKKDGGRSSRASGSKQSTSEGNNEGKDKKNSPDAIKRLGI